MPLHKLANDDTKIEILRLHNEGFNCAEISRVIGVHKSNISRFIKGESHVDWWEKNNKPIAAGNFEHHHSNVKRLNEKRYIITSAQNNTFVHRKFLNSIENMAEHIGAQIIVGTFTYNKSGFQNNTKDDEELWYDREIEEYIIDEPVMLADKLLWCGELNILPTAVNPLSGLQSYTKNNSGIIPHTKVQLESLPRLKSEDPRTLYTTGAVTKRNYIAKKAGQKAEFHHIFGALLVEVDDDGTWFVRQLIADSTGSFYDLDVKYTPDGYTTGHSVEAINWGDLHAEKRDDQVYDISFRNSNSMLDHLKPKFQFCHDTLDFEARNHHNIKDPYFRFKSYINGKDSVQMNIVDVYNTFKSMHRDFSKIIIVESNHDLAIERWLKEADYKTDPENAIFFLKLQLAKYESMEKNEDMNIFEYALRMIDSEYDEGGFISANNDDFVFLEKDQSFKICDGDGNGIECGSHGHLGNNGGRGSIRAFQLRGSRQNVGHTHSECIRDGVYYAGVSGKLDMGYNSGGTTWTHGHIVTYGNSKRTIVSIKNGKYRALN